MVDVVLLCFAIDDYCYVRQMFAMHIYSSIVLGDKSIYYIMCMGTAFTPMLIFKLRESDRYLNSN